MEALNYGESLRHTVAEYRTWPDEFRCELIDGEIYMMSPATRSGHASVVFQLSRLLGNYLEGKRCAVFISPFDVEFSEYDVVQPDIVVTCKPELIVDSGLTGAPDFVAEVLSPKTRKRDLTEKRELYEKHQVAEYWIIDPKEKYVDVYILHEGKYLPPTRYTDTGVIKISALLDCVIDLNVIFRSPMSIVYRSEEE
ncbi:hypothetical protein AGMMS49992_00260 [Clostridia bacterium]|nr:hypothetical protein AGMMS49992_00260 [Clostridia bacterium]